MRAYEDCLEATSTDQAPWYAVPADDKPNARLIVSQVVLETMQSLKMRYPSPDAARLKDFSGFGKSVIVTRHFAVALALIVAVFPALSPSAQTQPSAACA
jgi:hypothetical protein